MNSKLLTILLFTFAATIGYVRAESNDNANAAAESGTEAGDANSNESSTNQLEAGAAEDHHNGYNAYYADMNELNEFSD